MLTPEKPKKGRPPKKRVTLEENNSLCLISSPVSDWGLTKATTSGQKSENYRQLINFPANNQDLASKCLVVNSSNQLKEKNQQSQRFTTLIRSAIDCKNMNTVQEDSNRESSSMSNLTNNSQSVSTVPVRTTRSQSRQTPECPTKAPEGGAKSLQTTTCRALKFNEH